MLGYSEAAMLLRRPKGLAIDAVISIHGQREFGVEAEGVERLDLVFDDVSIDRRDHPDAVRKQADRRRLEEKTGLRQSPPTAEHVGQIIAFAEAIRDRSQLLLCHCGAGISRSPAAGLICLAVWHGAGSEEDCVKLVSKLRPCAMPHRGMIALADEQLARKGELMGWVDRLARIM